MLAEGILITVGQGGNVAGALKIMPRGNGRKKGDDLFFSEHGGIALWSESKQTSSLEKISLPFNRSFPNPNSDQFQSMGRLFFFCHLRGIVQKRRLRMTGFYPFETLGPCQLISDANVNTGFPLGVCDYGTLIEEDLKRVRQIFPPDWRKRCC